MIDSSRSFESRGKYDSADDGIRKRIVKTLEEGKGRHGIAMHNGVNYQTTHHWIHGDEFRCERLSRGEIRSKHSDDMEVSQMTIWLEDTMDTFEFCEPERNPRNI